MDQSVGGFGDEPGIKVQLMTLVRSVRTVMRGGCSGSSYVTANGGLSSNENSKITHLTHFSIECVFFNINFIIRLKETCFTEEKCTMSTCHVMSSHDNSDNESLYVG